MLEEAINTPTQEKHQNSNDKKSMRPNPTKSTADNAAIENRVENSSNARQRLSGPQDKTTVLLFKENELCII